MDTTNDLWNGGPWERPSQPLTPPVGVSLPGRSTQRPVLRLRKRRGWPFRIGMLALLVAGVLGLSLLIGQVIPSLFYYGEDDYDSYAYQQTDDTTPPNITRAPTGSGVTVTLHPAQGEGMSFSDIYEKNAPSIVSIESFKGRYYSTGTGVVLTEDGYLITNAHVVAGATRVDVYTSGNHKFPAALVGFDGEEDLAVLKIETTGLTPAQFGDSFQLACGDPVAALGDPLGYRSTITDGIISALDREVNVDGGSLTLIQTSAAINFGNSGGALINRYGQVVGITTVKIVSRDGSVEALGFAIPSQRVKFVADTLIAGKPVRRGVFGFTAYHAAQEGGGLMLQSVHPQSDGWKKGLREGDIILAANGQPVNAMQDLYRVRLPLGEGDAVSITYLHEGKEQTIDLLLVDPALID